MFDPKVVTLSVLIPLGLVAGLPAMAQDAGPRSAEVFAELDADGDGALSLEELQAGRGGDRFAQADTDGDGTITRDEMLAQVTERAEAGVDRFFDRFDADEDGAVTQEEIAEAREAQNEERRARMAERIFERMDADGDGTVSEEEFADAAGRLREHMGRGGEGRGGLFGNRG